MRSAFWVIPFSSVDPDGDASVKTGSGVPVFIRRTDLGMLGYFLKYTALDMRPS